MMAFQISPSHHCAVVDPLEGQEINVLDSSPQVPVIRVPLIFVCLACPGFNAPFVELER